MARPNLFIVYVRDVAASTAFYSQLFEMQPQMTTPRFVEYEIAPGVGLALWAGRPDALDGAPARTSEVCLNLSGGPERIEAEHQRWVSLGARIVEAPHDDVFGRTFVAEDPDGNLLRVAPVD